MNGYITVKSAASDEFVEKRSRFIGHIKPVATQDEAVAFINEIKSRHWNAAHNVYAYVLRDGNARRYSDDGEPQGTAGLPVLDVLLSAAATDCVIVVTRYFGGVLLGTGGLVRAYSHAAKLAFAAGGTVKMLPCDILKLSMDYSFYGQVSALISKFGGLIDETTFADNVTLTFAMPRRESEAFKKELTDLSSGALKCDCSGVSYHPFETK